MMGNEDGRIGRVFDVWLQRERLHPQENEQHGGQEDQEAQIKPAAPEQAPVASREQAGLLAG